ncbi:non-ribosomal peptide synthetase [Puia dinghuensis]|uniref:non-ribosomal peptide synthetase n=1 Tax=Puia dinghuensis TaxID=1792502 RepID=UPI0021D1FF03|nr:non-ribosomal peptide synthetase [Puia dinghuensis]
MYTSGSTGRPKGVMIEHRGLVNVCLGQADFFRLKPGMKTLQFASFGFDASCSEIFATLVTGGCLVLPDKEDIGRIDRLGALIDRQHIQVITLPPSYQQLAKEVLPPFCTIISAGEPLNRETGQYLRAKGIRLLNAYGPTENTICATMTDEPIREDGTIVIGPPMVGVRIYILNRQARPVPQGVPGEIYISGVGVARGYLNRPQLTAERFLPDPFSRGREQMFRTGDLGRWLPDGNIEYLGRLDEQVKIRGYRIEPGEVESLALQSGFVEQCVVTARKDHQGNLRLVGYVVAREGFDRTRLLTHLHRKLPAYMVPGIWVSLEAIPTTVNGKVDKEALPEPDAADLSAETYFAPRNTTEEALATIWQDLLGIERIGIRDNFFALGGDSIITIQVTSRARRLGYDLRPKDIFQYPDIEGLAAALASRFDVSGGKGQKETLQGKCGLFPIQQWYLAKEEDNGQVSHFNQSLLLDIDRAITAEDLSWVLNQLTTHHDALRCRFERTASGWTQVYGDTTPVLTICDLSGIGDQPEQTLSEKAACFQETLDLTRGDLVRMVLFLMPSGNNRLLLVIHHLVVDGVSWRILTEDLERLLTARREETPVVWDADGSSCRDWYEALEAYGNSLHRQQSYWEELSARGAPLPVDLEQDPQPEVRARDWRTVVLHLPEVSTRQLLQEAPTAYHTEINDVLLAALAKTLHAWTGYESISIGLEGHGREESIATGIDLGRTVGWFTTAYPVLLGSATAWADLIRETKENLRRIPDKGLGYGVLRYIRKAEGLQGPQPWEIVFNYLGKMDREVRKGKWFRPAAESTGPLMGAAHKMQTKISLNCWVAAEELHLSWGYSGLHYREDTIRKLGLLFMENLKQLVAHCIRQGALSPVWTPSDFGLGKEIGYQELDAFFSRQQPEKPVALYRLSGLQEGMLFHSLYNEGLYTEQLVSDISGVVPEVLRRSLQQLLRRHTILRSSFHIEPFRIPVQCVWKEALLPMEVLDFRDAAPDAVRAFEQADRKKPFDPARPPLMRLTLLRLGEDNYRMILTVHHVLLDGWSVAILLEELQDVYEHHLAGHSPGHSEEDRFEDYIRYLERQNPEEEKAFWSAYLSGASQQVLLPFITHQEERTMGVGQYAEEQVQLDKEYTERLYDYARRQQVTVNTLLQGIWSYLLHRYTGQKDVVFGVTVSGRPADLPRVETRVGMYINTLPLYVAVEEEALLGDWLRTLQAEQVACRQYQYSRLTDIRTWMGTGENWFDTLLVFENYPASWKVQADQRNLRMHRVRGRENTNYPLALRVGAGEELWIGFSYNTRLIDTDSVRSICGHFRLLLHQLADGPPSRLGDLGLLTREEESELWRVSTGTPSDYPRHQTVIDLFEAQATLRPHRWAVVSGDSRLTYQMLSERSNQLAAYLQSAGVSGESLVGICTGRSEHMIVGILSILMAGGAYVPIEPEYPPDRISHMLEDMGAEVVLTTRSASSSLPPAFKGRVVLLDEEGTDIYKTPVLPRTPIRPHQVAYVLYTSGSTGRPKGVMIEHRNLMYLLFGFLKAAGAEEDDAGLSVCPYVFDVSVWEFFTSLCFGNTLHLLAGEQAFDPAYLTRYIGDNMITTAYLPPTLLADTVTHMEETGRTLPLRRLLVGVSSIQQRVLQRWCDAVPGLRIINGYGPTETTICATFFPFREAAQPHRNTPIGKPVAGARVYILDSTLRLLPKGVPGEICIGGEGVGRGYLGKDHANRFIQLPGHIDTRIYRTGDLGRWLPDNNIEYLGRLDDQVKIRGFRVEPGEVEHQIIQSGLVRQVVVIAREERLVGYVVPDDGFDQASLLGYLNNRLPAYMIPTAWAILDVLPVTANGKVDKKALPEPTRSSSAGEAPRSETETVLAGIWEELFGILRPGIDDNFFVIGGHSLAAMRMVAQIEKSWGIRLSVKTIFRFPTIRSLSEYLEVVWMNDTASGDQNEYEVFELS